MAEETTTEYLRRREREGRTRKRSPTDVKENRIAWLIFGIPGSIAGAMILVGIIQKIAEATSHWPSCYPRAEVAQPQSPPGSPLAAFFFFDVVFTMPLTRFIPMAL